MKIQIALNRNIDKARSIIYNYFTHNKISIEEIDFNPIYLFNIRSSKNRFSKEIYDEIARLILELIFNLYSKDIINKQIRKGLNTLKSDERNKIVDIAEDLLLCENNFSIEKDYIVNQIKEYINEKSFISIEGFLTFRLKGFNTFIDLVIDRGIKEFTVEKEYKEFIRMLRYFVEVQESKYDLINIVFEGKDYKILDKHDNHIDNVIFDEVIDELDYIEINEDDLLISSLIVLCPQRIVLHLEDKSKITDVIKIITDVFQNRVYFCWDCKKCVKKSKIKNDKLMKLNN